MALGELLAVRAVQQRHVGVDRHLGAHRLEDPHLLGRVGVVVGAADDVRDAGVEVVDDHREVVDGRAVGAGDHEVVHQAVLEGALAADDVAHHGGALVGHPQPDGALPLVLAAEAGVAVGLLVGLDLLGARRGAVGVAAGDQLLDDLGVPVARARTGRRGRRPSPGRASAGPRRSARRSPASSARGRCPRCAGRTPRRDPAPGASCTAPSAPQPMWSAPVGDGAKRTRILDTACHGTRASRADADRRPRLPRRRARQRRRPRRGARLHARSSSSTRARAPGGPGSTPRRRSPPTTRRSPARRSTPC